MPGLIPGEAIQVSSTLTGLGSTIPSQSDHPLSFLDQFDPLLNLGGVYTSSGMIFDLPTARTESLTLFVESYPELKTLLDEDPDFLKKLSPQELEQLSFKFYVAAAATPLTAEEYIERKRLEATQIRSAILRDAQAPLSLITLASDASTWGEAYLNALLAAGFIRPEDLPPAPDARAESVSDLFVATAGILGTDAESRSFAKSTSMD